MNGSDELQKAVKAGAVSLVRAAAVAKKPEDQQAKALREKAKPKAKPKAAPAVS